LAAVSPLHDRIDRARRACLSGMFRMMTLRKCVRITLLVLGMAFDGYVDVGATTRRSAPLSSTAGPEIPVQFR
jgi:hypothetical protein